MRCGGTFFIHTDKSLTCLAKLLVIEIPYLRTQEKPILEKVFVRIFALTIRLPKEAKDSSSSFKELMTTSKSPRQKPKLAPINLLNWMLIA